jgi:hypothetical protein
MEYLCQPVKETEEMTLKEINALSVSRGINLAFRMRAAEDITKFQTDGVILLHYYDNYTQLFIKVCKVLNIDIEAWARPYPNTDRYGHKRPYLTVYIIIPGKTTSSWDFLKRTSKLEKVTF